MRKFGVAIATASTALAALSLAASPAHADNTVSYPVLLNCGPGQDILNNTAGDPKVLGSLIAVNENGWRVVYAISNGTPNNDVVTRIGVDGPNLAPTQYQSLRAGPTIDGQIAWYGSLKRSPNLTMEGKLLSNSQDQSDFAYEEDLWDNNQNGKLIVRTKAACVRIYDFQTLKPWPHVAYSTATPRPAPAPVAQVPAPYVAPQSTPAGSDSIALFSEDGGLIVNIMVGNQPVRALVDTGATSLVMPQQVVDELISAGQASYIDRTADVTLADGSTMKARFIHIDRVEIGRHILSDVIAVGKPAGATPLLGINVLNKIGRFTIDAQAHLLVFG